MTDILTTRKAAISILLRETWATAADIAEQTGFGTRYVQQCLADLHAESLVTWRDATARSGRDAKHWSLTMAGIARFRAEHHPLTPEARLALLDGLLDLAWKLPLPTIVRALQLHRRNPDPEEVIQMPELQKLFNDLSKDGTYHVLQRLRQHGLIEDSAYGGRTGGYSFQRIGLPPAKEQRRG